MSGVCGGDRGSASIWVLACSALVMLTGIVGLLRTTAVLARHRAESAADFAALAAAGQIGISDDMCGAARRFARTNGGMLVGCEVSLGRDGRTGTVGVEVRMVVHLPAVGGLHVTATARAARLPAATAGQQPASWSAAARGAVGGSPAGRSGGREDRLGRVIG